MKAVNQKVIVIVGPTSSGKTKLAVRLARRFGGEIVSADSRQVYRGMDIGTGKDLQDYAIKQIANRESRIVTIPYHLIDVVSPKQQFTVADYQHRAYRAIDDILSRGRLPIVCGGTGLYITVLTEGYVLPKSQIANRKSPFGAAQGDLKFTERLQIARRKLSPLSLPPLLSRLKKIDPETYRVIDKKNRRRVQRALEIFYLTGRPKSEQPGKQKPPYRFLLLGIAVPKTTLHRRIHRRLLQRLDQGMIAEISRLHRQGVSWKKLESFGLEYRWVAQYLQKKIIREQLAAGLEKAIQQFSKRQMTWFKRDKNIRWVATSGQATVAARRFTGQQ